MGNMKQYKWILAKPETHKEFRKFLIENELKSGDIGLRKLLERKNE